MMTPQTITKSTSKDFKNKKNSDTDFLQKCFFIYDSTSMEEETPADEAILFFYPPETKLNTQLYLLGGCVAMINFATQFSETPLQLMTMDRTKIAFIESETVVLVLTGSVEHPDSTILNHLQILFHAFEFFYGSFSRLYQDISRKALITSMNKIGVELIPLFLYHYHKNAMKAFNPLTTTPFPEGMNRYFIEANQVLFFIKRDSGNYGAVIFHTTRRKTTPQTTLLCSHLNLNLTRYIRSRIEHLQLTEIGNKENTDLYEWKLEVFLTEQEFKELAPDQNVEEHDEVVPGKIKVGLYIVATENISVCTLMKSSLLLHRQHTPKLRLILSPTIQSLSFALAKGYLHGRIINNVNITNTQTNYNFISYDELSKVAKGVPLIPGFEISFVQGISNAHHTFSQNPKISQILLRDHNGGIYCRKIFGKEFYFQKWNNNMIHEKFMEEIEKTVRSILKKDHSINLF